MTVTGECPDFDVAIVGGGPAGTSAALHLVRREGVAPSRIVMFEKAKHPRDKPCAGAVSAWGLEALEAIGVPLEVPHAPICGLRVLAGRHTGGYEGPLGAVVRRCEFDASLWRKTCDDGVVAFDGEPVLAVKRHGGGWVLQTSARTVSARLLVASDGAGSRVRKLLSLREAARKGHLYVAETPITASDEGPRAGLCDFDLRVADDGVEGYYWDFPTVMNGAPAVSRGIYHANRTPRRDLKQDLTRALAGRGLDGARILPRAFSTRPLVRGSTLVAPGLALVGEAAGIDATTGEGIAQAIGMGRLAAAHIARALRVRDPAALTGYARALPRTRMGRHLLQSAWFARRVYGDHGARWRAFLASDPLARDAGARWYAGRSVGWPMVGHLALRLARTLAFAPGV